MDTIYALASGHPPAAIAIVRLSGSMAMEAATRLTGRLPVPRRAAMRTLRDADGGVLDHAIVIVFPGPNTATGEDLVELHLHGGRAVVAAVEAELARFASLRRAQAGEFTRRALENGRIDFSQAQGLGDLLQAETEGERRAAIAATEGALGRALSDWHARLTTIAAQAEAAIDYVDEDDVDEADLSTLRRASEQLSDEMQALAARPTVERLRDGPVVVLAGPPNAGKSSLFNALLSRDAAIVTPIAGTTRDVLEAAVIRNGRAYRLVDTAGLHDAGSDMVERIGIERARTVAAAADLVLWLGSADDKPGGAYLVASKADLLVGDAAGHGVSIYQPDTVEALWRIIATQVADGGFEDDIRLHERQRDTVVAASAELRIIDKSDDLLLISEHLRRALVLVSGLLALDPTEAMLDTLFSRFCVGK